MKHLSTSLMYLIFGHALILLFGIEDAVLFGYEFSQYPLVIFLGVVLLISIIISYITNNPKIAGYGCLAQVAFLIIVVIFGLISGAYMEIYENTSPDEYPYFLSSLKNSLATIFIIPYWVKLTFDLLDGESAK